MNSGMNGGMNSKMNGGDNTAASGIAPGTHAERLQAALATLNASRQVLRAELIPSTAESRADPGGASKRASPWGLRWRQLRRAVRSWPVAAVATDALQHWWRSHPWYAAGNVLADGVLDQARPLLRRHPVASVLGAAALGAAVVATRPWRWPLLRDQLRPLPGGVGRWLVLQLSSAPMQTALASLLLMALQTQEPAAPEERKDPQDPEEGQDSPADAAADEDVATVPTTEAQLQQRD